MKKLFNVINLIFMIILFTLGCSQKKDKYIDEIYVFKAEAAIEVIKKSEVSCFDNDCPAFVGSMFNIGPVDKNELFSKNGDLRVSFCSVQLIKSNQILTNRHCLEDLLQNQDTFCSERVFVKFPKINNYEEEFHSCLKIVEVSTNAEEDWAIFELNKESKRPFASIKPSAITSNETHFSYPSYFSLANEFNFKGRRLKTVKAKILKLQCQPSMDHYMTTDSEGPYFKTPWYKNFIATCDYSIIKGNSGSGFFNQNLELVGINKIGKDPDVKIPVTTNFGSNTEINDKFVVGDNFLCSTYFNKGERSPFCDQDFSFLKEVDIDFRQFVTAFNFSKGTVTNENLSPTFEWTTAKVENGWHWNLTAVNNKYYHGMDVGQDVLDYIDNQLNKNIFVKVPRCVKSSVSEDEFMLSMIIRNTVKDDFYEADGIRFTPEVPYVIIAKLTLDKENDMYQLEFINYTNDNIENLTNKFSYNLYNLRQNANLFPKVSLPKCN